MTRTRSRTLLTTILPSMLAGGLLFGNAFGHAATGGDDLLGFWPAASDATAPTVAQAGSGTTAPTAPTPPKVPPANPRAAAPPSPPRPPARPVASTAGKAGAGVSVSFHNGQLQIDGIKDLVIGQLDAARATLRGNAQLPKDVRDKVLARLDKVRATVDKRMSNVKLTDLAGLGDELEKMGEEIEQAMAGLDADLSKLGDRLKRDLGAQLGKDLVKTLGTNPSIALGLDDDDDLQDAIADLKGLGLRPAQRDAITKLRADADKTIAPARRQLDELSGKLHAALGNPATADADIARYVDQISAQEAAIRKARLLAWANARRVLDDGQRAKIQDAVKKKTK